MNGAFQKHQETSKDSSESPRRQTFDGLAMINSMFEFIIEEYRSDHRWVWAIIVAAVAMVSLIIAAFEWGLSRSQLFPAADRRLDISTIYMQDMKVACPNETRLANRPAFEACVRRLEAPQNPRNELVPVNLPTFDEIGATPKSFVATLKDDDLQRLPYDRTLLISAPKLAKDRPNEALKAVPFLANGRYYVIGIPIPASKFVRDENAVDYEIGSDGVETTKFAGSHTDYQVLTFRGMRYGRVCVDGVCNQEATAKLTGVNTFALRTTNVSEGNERWVWIFGLESDLALGINLSDGLFIASSADLLTAKQLYGLYYHGPTMRATIWLVALFLVSLVFAFIYRRFLDYPLLSYFAASFALWLGQLFFGVEFAWLRMERYFTMNLWIWNNLAIAMVAYCAALTRKPRRQILFGVLVAWIVNITWTASSRLPAMTMAAWKSVWPIYQTIFTFSIALVTLGIFARALQWLDRTAKNEGQTLLASQAFDYARRRSELCWYMGIFGVFWLTFGYFEWQGMMADMIMEFSSLTLMSFCWLLGIMLHYTTSKRRTRILTEPLGEVDRLYERLPDEEFSAIFAAARCDILFVPDLSGSTDKNNEVKADLMYRLPNMIRRDMEDRGFYIFYIANGGDDWKIVPCRQSSGVAENLRDFTLMLQERRAVYLDLVQQTFADCSLHLCLYVLPDNCFMIDRSEQALGTKSTPVFSSRAANVLLKFLGKPLVRGAIMVAGPRLMLEDLTCNLRTEDSGQATQASDGTLSQELRSVGDLIQAKKDHLPSHLAMAEAFDLAYTHLDITRTTSELQEGA